MPFIPNSPTPERIAAGGEIDNAGTNHFARPWAAAYVRMYIGTLLAEMCIRPALPGLGGSRLGPGIGPRMEPRMGPPMRSRGRRPPPPRPEPYRSRNRRSMNGPQLPAGSISPPHLSFRVSPAHTQVPRRRPVADGMANETHTILVSELPPRSQTRLEAITSIHIGTEAEVINLH